VTGNETCRGSRPNPTGVAQAAYAYAYAYAYEVNTGDPWV